MSDESELKEKIESMDVRMKKLETELESLKKKVGELNNRTRGDIIIGPGSRRRF